MIEVRDNILFVKGHPVGDEEKLMTIFDKAVKYDEIEASFKKRGDA